MSLDSRCGYMQWSMKSWLDGVINGDLTRRSNHYICVCMCVLGERERERKKERIENTAQCRICNPISKKKLKWVKTGKNVHQG